MMQFDSLTAVLEMGGHGLFVWLSFASALLVLAYNLISPIVTERQLKRELQRRKRRQEMNV